MASQELNVCEYCRCLDRTRATRERPSAWSKAPWRFWRRKTRCPLSKSSLRWANFSRHKMLVWMSPIVFYSLFFFFFTVPGAASTHRGPLSRRRPSSTVCRSAVSSSNSNEVAILSQTSFSLFFSGRCVGQTWVVNHLWCSGLAAKLDGFFSPPLVIGTVN